MTDNEQGVNFPIDLTKHGYIGACANDDDLIVFRSLGLSASTPAPERDPCGGAREQDEPPNEHT